jgi:hypothetical protein
VTPEVDPALAPSHRRVPYQLVQRLTHDSTYVAEAFPRYRFRPWHNRVDAFTAMTTYVYGRALMDRSAYEKQHGRIEVADRYARYALGFDPGIVGARLPALFLDGRAQVHRSAVFFRDLRREIQRSRR